MAYGWSWKARCGAASIALVCTLTAHKAQAAYPDHPVHLIVGYSPGGGLDIMARVIAEALSRKWGQPVVVENRSGADGSIGAGYVARASADGYTLIMVTNAHAMPVQGYTQTYDPVKSFAPATMFVSRPTLLVVNPSLGVNNVKELIALAKAKPGALNYSSVGPSTNPAMLTRIFMQKTGIKMTEVNYKGGGEDQIALLSGEVQVHFATLSENLGEVRAGRLKALAVTSATRTPLLPDVPTIAEAADLPGYNETIWNMVLTPAGTPPDIVSQIYRDVQDVTKTPEVRKAFENQEATAVDYNPQATKEFLTSQIEELAALYGSPSSK